MKEESSLTVEELKSMMFDHATPNFVSWRVGDDFGAVTLVGSLMRYESVSTGDLVLAIGSLLQMLVERNDLSKEKVEEMTKMLVAIAVDAEHQRRGESKHSTND